MSKKVKKNAGKRAALAETHPAEPADVFEPPTPEEVEAALAMAEPTPVAEHLTDEERVYILAKELMKTKGQFTINNIWHAMSPEREDEVWYAIKKFLYANPDLFERINNLAWKVKEEQA